MVNEIFPSLIGRTLMDESGGEMGRMISFIIDSSGNVREMLVESKGEMLIRHPVERPRCSQEDVFLIFGIEKDVEKICEKMPILLKKREILESLFKNKEILSEIYENLCVEIDKSINEIRVRAQNLLKEIDDEIRCYEDSIRMLHLSRTFLEMERGVGNIRDEVLRQSLLPILRELKSLSHKKMNLFKIRERILSLSQYDTVLESGLDQKSIIDVRITDK
ncbi:MAG: hypothetical protein QXR84_00550 [Candidatus Bathyarchaeia archaeon]